jgi:hypothetical protein
VGFLWGAEASALPYDEAIALIRDLFNVVLNDAIESGELPPSLDTDSLVALFDGLGRIVPNTDAGNLYVQQPPPGWHGSSSPVAT